ncbi:MAG: hypothetical protein H6936_01740 [Burkholderiales bacterium]|nr:hypothetical protein [Burkholderiales bacterium]
MSNKEYESIERIKQATIEPENEVSGKIYNVEVDEYFLTLKSDLNQIDRLVNDAVTNLVINFKYINELSKSHHEMVMTIEKLSIPKENKPVLELLNKQMAIGEKIERELESALTSLQFGDLVSQLLAHTTRQIEMLNFSLQHIDQIKNNPKKTEKSHEINNEISLAVQLAHSKKLNKPVVQQEMQNGEIELF